MCSFLQLSMFQLKVVIGEKKRISLLAPPSASGVHVWRVRLCFVIPVHGDRVSQVLDVALISETRSSFVQGYYEGLIGAIVRELG